MSKRRAVFKVKVFSLNVIKSTSSHSKYLSVLSSDVNKGIITCITDSIVDSRTKSHDKYAHCAKFVNVNKQVVLEYHVDFPFKTCSCHSSGCLVKLLYIWRNGKSIVMNKNDLMPV